MSHISQAGFELTIVVPGSLWTSDAPASSYWVLKLQQYATTPGLCGAEDWIQSSKYVMQVNWATASAPYNVHLIKKKRKIYIFKVHEL